MAQTSSADLLAALMAAAQAFERLSSLDSLRDSDDLETAISLYQEAADYCSEIERYVQRIYTTVERRRKTLTARPASVAAMTTYIVKQIEERTVKPIKDLAGGEKAKALARAEGRCELCAREWQLSVHHIIPRAEGGLSEPDNFIVLCKTCHDDVEDQGYRTRAEVMRHIPARSVLLQPRADEVEAAQEKARRAEKAAATKQANAVREAHEDREIADWAAQFDSGFWKRIAYVALGEEPPPDPKWYATVYGGKRR